MISELTVQLLVCVTSGLKFGCGINDYLWNEGFLRAKNVTQLAALGRNAC